jgi:predicted ferric reductase
MKNSTRPSFPNPRVTWEVVLWMSVFFAVVTIPMVVAMPSWWVPMKANGILRDFASALGYAGASTIGVLFALTARFPRATSQFGIDVVFHFHRYLALFALGIVLLHVGILVVGYPGEALKTRPSLIAGWVALALFLTMAAWSLARSKVEKRQVRPWWWEYDRWRIGHALLATAAYALVLWHLFAVAPSLGNGWRLHAWMAYGAVWIALIVWVRVLRPIGPRIQRWTVIKADQERLGLWTVSLRAATGRKLRFLPGQFVWMTMADSPFRMREHPFSIASAAHPDGNDAIDLVIAEKGDFTSRVGALQPGVEIWIDGPYGRFTVAKRPGAALYVLAAGGTGIAPVMSMLRTAADAELHDRSHYVLLYFNRRGKAIPFHAALDGLAASMKGRLVIEYVATDGTGKDYIKPEVLAKLLPAPSAQRYECFLCGPLELSRQVEQALHRHGVSGARIHQELFAWV